MSRENIFRAGAAPGAAPNPPPPPGPAPTPRGAVTQSTSDTTSGRLVKAGDYGWGGNPVSVPGSNIDNIVVAGQYSVPTSVINGSPALASVPLSSGSTLLHLQFNADNASQILITRPQLQMWFRHKSQGTWLAFVRVWHGSNTTVDGNGFVKTASPVVRVARTAEAAVDIEGGFAAAGCGAANAAASGAEVIRDGVGLYRITGTLGLAQSGWQIELPRDLNGNRLIHVDTAWTDGVLTITTAVPQWSDGRWIAGDPLDVPESRWVDVRLHEAPETVDIDADGPGEG